MEIDRQGDPKDGDISDDEEEDQEEAVELIQESAKLKLLKLVLGFISRPKIKISIYDSSLKTNTLIDWVSELDKYFEYKEIDEEKKVKFVVTRLKGHATLWWESVQVYRRSKHKPCENF